MLITGRGQFPRVTVTELTLGKLATMLPRLFLHVTCIYDYVILCHCTLAAALYFEQSSCDELMEFKQIQTRAQPEESLKHTIVAQTCHRGHGHCFFTPVTGLCNYGYVLMIPRAAPSFESV